METIEFNELKAEFPYLIKHRIVWSNYDEEADTLYLHFKKPNLADRSEMNDDEIIIGYRGDEIIGLTVLNASLR